MDQPSALAAAQDRWLREIYRGHRLPELGLRVFLLGGGLCVLMTTLNVYMGLKTGWNEPGSLLSVIIAVALTRVLGRTLGPLETNATQAMASSGGALGCVVNVVPAMSMLAAAGLAAAPTFLDIWLLCLCTSLLGPLLVLPLRRQMLEVDQLRFPTGTATAQTIEALETEPGDAGGQARVLAWVAGASALLRWLTGWNPGRWFGERVATLLPLPELLLLPGRLGPLRLESCTAGIALSPLLLGGGFLVGARVGLSLLAGAAACWLWLVPWLHQSGILASIAASFGDKTVRALAAGQLYAVAVKWTMWPAIGLMVASSLTATALRWRTIVETFRSMGAAYRRGGGASLEPSRRLYLSLLLSTLAAVALLAHLRFAVPLALLPLLLPLAFVLAAIATRATGETDITPTGQMGAVAQVATGLSHPGHASCNLVGGGISAAASFEAANVMQAFRAGHLLGSTPRRILYASLAGIAIAAPVAAALYLVFVRAYGVGSAALPMPAGTTWSGLAQMVARSSDALPPLAMPALLCGIATGVLLAITETRRPWLRRVLPSAMGLGIGCIVPAFYSTAICLGSLVAWGLARKWPTWMERHGATVGAGGIVGEGVVGALLALLVVAGLQ